MSARLDNSIGRPKCAFCDETRLLLNDSENKLKTANIEIAQLKKKIDDTGIGWKNDYAFHMTRGGLPVMTRKLCDNEEEHWLCSPCFQKDKKSPLVILEKDPNVFCFCPICGDREHPYQVDELPAFSSRW